MRRGPCRVTVLTPAAPAVVEIRTPAAPSIVQVVGQGQPGLPGRDGNDPGVMHRTAGQAIGGQRAVGMASDGRLVPASSDELDHFERVIGITMHAAEADAPIAVRRVGEMEDPSWQFSVGPIWLGRDGALVQVPPSEGFMQQIAFADRPTRIFVTINEPVQVTPSPE